MPSFVTIGPDWVVEDIGDERYHVFAAWDWSGKRFLGVAGGEGLEELLGTVAVNEAKKAASNRVALAVRFRCVRVGPTPRAASANARIEVLVRRDVKTGWAVAGMRDLPGPRPRRRKVH